MKMRPAIALLLFLLPACRSTGMKDPPLTLDQSTAILRELVSLTEWIEDGENMERCPLGGGARVVVAEDLREREDTVWVSSRWSITPDRCEIQAVGDTLLLEGSPSVVVESVVRYVGFFFDEGVVDMEFSGAVSWRRNDESSGVCEVAVAVEDAETNPQTGEIDGTLTGSLCGLDAAVHFSEL